MVRVRSSPATGNLTIYFGSSFQGMFEFFKHEYAGSFSHNKTVTVLIIRPGSCFGIIIPFTKGFHGIKPSHAGFAYHAFGSARKLDRFTQTAVVASDQAVQDAGIDKDNVNADRVGVVFASGIGGLITFQEEVINFAKGDGTPRYNPFFMPKIWLVFSEASDLL